MRLGNVKLWLDSKKKKEAYQLPLKSELRKNFRSKERTTFISLHALCTQCFARFSVSPTFLRANFYYYYYYYILLHPVARRRLLLRAGVGGGKEAILSMGDGERGVLRENKKERETATLS